MIWLHVFGAFVLTVLPPAALLGYLLHEHVTERD